MQSQSWQQRIHPAKICQAIKAIEYERMFTVIMRTQLCQVLKREPSEGTKFAPGENLVTRLVGLTQVGRCPRNGRQLRCPAMLHTIVFIHTRPGIATAARLRARRGARAVP